MSVTPIVIPVDPRETLLGWLEPLLPTILPGWRCGWRQDHGYIPGVTPAQYIMVDVIGDVQRNHLADDYTVLFQFFGPDGMSDDRQRTHAARAVSAQVRRQFNGRTVSQISLPDPTDRNRARSITQLTMALYLRGTDG